MNDLSRAPLKEQGFCPRPVLTAPDYDDDDDAADDDYDDDDEGIARPRHERWQSRAGFGSPEWWTGW
jgi:hypothetical protein